MDEEISIIDSNTRNQKIKDFFIKNKKIIFSIIIIFVLILVSFYSYQIFQDQKKKQLSDKYNNSVIDYKNGSTLSVTSSMKEVINDQDSTYSPLALYFLIDNNLIENRDEINELFNILINKTKLETEIKNLIIYKKALYNADFVNENELLDLLNPLINSKSVWKSHALYLVAEYFYSKNEKQKSKEFFKQIFNIENANTDIIREAQKRLIRDLGE